MSSSYFFPDNLIDQGGRGEDSLEPFDLLDDVLVVLNDLFAFETRQALESHVQDFLRLDVGEVELLDKAPFGFSRSWHGTDEGNHCVEIIERFFQPFQDMGALFGLPQFELGALYYDLTAKIEKMLQNRLEAHDLRPVIHHGEHDDAESALERRVLVELIFDDFGIVALAQGNDDPHPVAVGFVANVRDSFDSLQLYQFGYAFEQLCLVHLEGNLGDDEVLLSARFLDFHPAAHLDHALAGLVGFRDPLASVKKSGSRKVRDPECGA